MNTLSLTDDQLLSLKRALAVALTETEAPMRKSMEEGAGIMAGFYAKRLATAERAAHAVYGLDFPTAEGE